MKVLARKLLSAFGRRKRPRDLPTHPQDPPLRTRPRDPPIYALPVELLLYIFDYCDPKVKHRLALAHTCRHWNLVVSGSPSLWTTVEVALRHFSNESDLRRLAFLLRMQVERTKGLALDVTWCHRSGASFNIKLIDLLRQKVPFARWRSLKLVVDSAPLHPEFLFRIGDTFSSLESLHIQGFNIYDIINTLSRTTTSKLRLLDVRDAEVNEADLSADGFDTLYGGILQRISRLVLPVDHDAHVNLPHNIVHLRGRERSTHMFPRILYYELEVCIFQASGTDLKHLTSLTVTYTLVLRQHCELILPTLRNLKFRTIWLGPYTKFEAPRLEELHISENTSILKYESEMIATRTSIKQPGYLLSPKHSLIVEERLPVEGMVRLLHLSPDIKKVELSFDDEQAAWEVVTRIAADGLIDTETPDPILYGGRLCDSMVDLRLNFCWPISELDAWKARVSRIVDAKTALGHQNVSIYGRWKGDGAYMRLA